MALDVTTRSRPLATASWQCALAAALLACGADASLAQGLAAKARES